ncbi:MAG: hypothetical protein V4685_03715 [Bacteroidota bacterium]
MENINTKDKKKKLVLFSLSLAAVMALMFLLGTSLNSNTAIKAVDKNMALLTQANLVISSNEKLQQKMAALQQFDQQYAAAISDPSFTFIADSLNKLILQEENNFRVALEAAGQEQASFTDESLKADFEKMLAAYRSLIDDRKAISNLRNVVAMQSNSLAPDEKKMLQLQDDVMEKNNRIAALESSIKTMAKVKTPVVTKTEDNKMLVQNIAELENKIASLNNINNSLKEENDRLVKYKADGSKTQSNAEQMLKEKNISLQQKIEDLNAEIQLVKVDCNLNRVDATQIISNSKQRKQLLNEASNILINLSASGNSNIKSRVNEKINRLNVVAANTRE